METPFAFLLQYAVQAPLLLIWLAGMALALVWWQRAPRVALTTCVACGLFFLDALVGTFISVALPRMMLERGQSATQVGTAFAIVGGLRSLLHAVLWGAVLSAIFSGRGPAPAQRGSHDDSRATSIE